MQKQHFVTFASQEVRGKTSLRGKVVTVIVTVIAIFIVTVHRM